jgi:hypothetical protein
MRAHVNDVWSEALLGLALLALAIVIVQIDAKSALRLRAPTVHQFSGVAVEFLKKSNDNLDEKNANHKLP